MQGVTTCHKLTLTGRIEAKEKSGFQGISKVVENEAIWLNG